MSCVLGALCLELGLGLAHANPQGDGMFYDAELPYVQHLNALTWSAGVAARDWRAGYEHLGRNGTDALVHPDNVPNGPRYAMHSEGTTEGLYLEYMVRQGRLHAEAGVWLYRASYWLNQPNAQPGTLTVDGGQSYSVGPLVGIGYGHLNWNIRGTPCRAKDMNGNNFPSTVKGFVQTITLRMVF